jgi:ADP-ribose pyrophosphatase YjhB (NUDIX family)
MHEFTYRFCPACGAPLEARLLRPGEPARPVCAACGFIHYANPKVAVGAVVEDDGGALILVRRAIEPGYGRWVFPGGFVDRGEPLETAAIREAREETGLDVRLDALVNVYSYPGAPVVVIVYAAGIVGGRLAVDEESLEAGRFPRARIPWDELAFDSTRDALHDYLAGLRHPIRSTAPKS